MATIVAANALRRFTKVGLRDGTRVTRLSTNPERHLDRRLSGHGNQKQPYGKVGVTAASRSEPAIGTNATSA